MNEFENLDLAPPPDFPVGVTFRSDLLRRAAEAGPGYRGRREALDPGVRRALAEEIALIGEAVPAYLESPSDWVDRRAKLFEAGEYPDKKVTIQESDLKRLADGFDLPVPVLIEHAHSPLELGYLTNVEAVGKELFGTISLTEEANALVEKSGARSLSLGLSKDMAEIREVSLVRKPRVQTAKLFNAELKFWAELETFDRSDLSERTDWKARYNELTSKVQAEEAARRVSELVRSGRLTPAQIPFATALLQSGGTIDFAGESRPVHELLIAMLEKQPPHALFTELAPASSSSAEALFLPEEAAFYRKHFPDVSLDVIAQRKRAH
jgi:hypothetical protein